MSVSREQSIAAVGDERYTGWGEQEMKNDMSSKGLTAGSLNSNGSGGGVNVDDYISAIQETLPTPPEEYMKANPFYFDEQAAREVSTAEFEPYYNELLSDYLGDIKLTSEKNQGDVTRILADLDKQKELFLKQNGTELDKTLRGIKEGYSGKGLYFSGTNIRDQNEATAANTNTLEGYLNTYGNKVGQAKAENTYSQAQLQRSADQKKRDIEREKTTAIYGGINTQKNEAIDEYLYGMKTYYKAPTYTDIASKLNRDTGNTNLQQGVQY